MNAASLHLLLCLTRAREELFVNWLCMKSLFLDVSCPAVESERERVFIRNPWVFRFAVRDLFLEMSVFCEGSQSNLEKGKVRGGNNRRAR